LRRVHHRQRERRRHGGIDGNAEDMATTLADDLKLNARQREALYPLILAFCANIDRAGNLWVASGWVYKADTQQLRESGADPNLSLASAAYNFMPFSSGIPVTGPATAAFIGGSGRLLIATPSMLLGNPDAVEAILGFYTPDWLDYWKSVANQSATLEVTSTTDAMIYDGTNTVAQWASGADAPLGVYAATTYGKDTYNAGVAFNITITEEITGGRVPGAADVEFSAGTAEGGGYFPSAATTFVNVVSDWTLTIDYDGVAEIKHLGNVVAIRSPLEYYIHADPGGTYESTAYGEDNFNSGEPFTARVTQRNRYPRSGYAIVQCNISSGDLISVAKPFFSTSIPANTSTETYVPIFYSNGSTVAQQLHTGMIILP
jgi:hypothetical protein